MPLSIYGRSPSSVFSLNGADENSASFALGWVLQQCPAYLHEVVAAIFGHPLDITDTVISLQQHGDDRGFTDVEIQSGRRFHAVLEAKRYWNIPGLNQLRRYTPRLINAKSERQRIVSISSCGRALAARRLPSVCDGVCVTHLSWLDLQSLARASAGRTRSSTERIWLQQLILLLQDYVAMERLTDNRVYVVSLNENPIQEGSSYTWIDVVEQDRCYFHMIGNTWPVQPPNYLGFRYRGRLQSVHHVDHYDIVPNLAEENPLWEVTNFDSFVYRLGPPMRPASEVRSGRHMRNSRVWCDIDTLLTGQYQTLPEAVAETKRRRNELK